MSDVGGVHIPVTIDGEQAVAALQNIQAAGVEAFTRIVQSALAGDFGPVIGMFNKTAEAVYETVVAIEQFAEAQAKAMVQFSDLAEGLGATLPQLQAIKDRFSDAGIGAQGFERSMTRLAQTVALSWSQVDRAVREGEIGQERANENIKSSMLGLERAYQDAANASSESAATMAHDADSVASAQLALRKAQLAENTGGQGKDLELEQQERVLAVQRAKQTVADALRKQQEDFANAGLREQEKQNAAEKAQLALEEARQHAQDAALKNVKNVSGEIEKVASGQQKWTDSTIDLSKVLPQTLKESVLEMAKLRNNGEDASGIQVFQAASDIISHMGTSAKEVNAQMVILRELMGTGFRSGSGQSIEQIRKAMVETPEAAAKMQAALEDTNGSMERNAQTSTEFTEAVSRLSSQWGSMTQKFTADILIPWIEPTINGLTKIIEKINEALDAYEKWKRTTTGKIVTGAVGTLLNPVGAAQDAADWGQRKLDELGGKPAESERSTTGVFAPQTDANTAATDRNTAAVEANTAAKEMPTAGSDVKYKSGLAAGGPISGPGGPRDDKAGLFPLSDGEFVMQTAAVQKYGIDLFHALNSLSVGGFAEGGGVGSSRVSTPMPSTAHPKPSSVLNLTIDGNQFRGLVAPNDVARQLKSYAVGRQNASTGVKPSWVQ